tara:strand:- start:170 stop:1237 length:1068 start_codon:yes stop_codon:yes gene_type:complete
MALSKVNPNFVSQLGRRNLIINGDMRIAQRGTTGTLNNGGGGFHSADRFLSQEEGAFTGAFTVSNDTDSPKGFSNSTKWDCTTADTSLAADDVFFVDYKPEAQDLQHLNYGTSDALQMTMSFWIKSKKTGTYVLWLYQYDGTRHVQMQYTINTADTWEYKTLLVPADTAGVINNDTGAGMVLRFVMGAGSSWTSGTAPTAWTSIVTADRHVGQTVNLADSTDNYMNLTGVQLEVGDTATDFEHRLYGEELAACKRYYQVVSASPTFGVDGIRARMSIAFPVEMRATPTVSQSAVITLSNPGVGTVTQSATSFSNIGSTKRGGSYQLANFSGMTETKIYHFGQSSGAALLQFDAEL